MEFANSLLALMTILDRLDTSRTRRRFWYPKPGSVWAHFRGQRHSKDTREVGQSQENEGETFICLSPATQMTEIADTFEGFEGEDDELLGEVRKRNPEFTPFDNKWLNALSYVGRATDVLHSRSFWYAIKAGAITVLAALPGFIA
jgi:hypothetical protein